MEFAHVQITTTTATEQQAGALASELVEAHLAACVQVVGPIQSTYRWKGNLEVSKEWMCVIKTTRSVQERVVQKLLESHPYENPEVTVVPIVQGSSSYLGWIDEEVSRGPGG